MKKLLIALTCLLSMAGSQAAYLNESGLNNSILTAQNVNGGFSLDSDEAISNSTTWAHVSLRGNGDNNDGQVVDYYRFSMGAGGLVLDIDFGMYDLDPFLSLYNSSGDLIAYNDDGGLFDNGSEHSWDSYMQLTLAAGEYIVGVSSYLTPTLLPGQDYILHISVENLPSAEIPEPTGLALAAFALIGLAATRKRTR